MPFAVCLQISRFWVLAWLLLPGVVVGQRAELPEYGDVVAHGQVLGDQARVVEGQYVDLPGGDWPVRGG
jgi:hypothetical protein